MGIFLFFLIFLALIALFAFRRREARERKVEVRALSGSRFIFSESGITYLSPGRVKFISSSEVKGFSVERVGNNFQLKVSDGKEEIVELVPKEELSKLFRSSPAAPQAVPVFPYLPLLGGALAGFLLASALSHPEVIVIEDGHRDFDLKNDEEDEFDYFDTGDWNDDNLA
ncbi:hypothetical protein [Thermovibrio sp.]